MTHRPLRPGSGGCPHPGSPTDGHSPLPPRPHGLYASTSRPHDLYAGTSELHDGYARMTEPHDCYARMTELHDGYARMPELHDGCAYARTTGLHDGYAGTLSSADRDPETLHSIRLAGASLGGDGGRCNGEDQTTQTKQ